MNDMALTRFPPSFDGNPWTYGLALFSLTLVSAICLTILVGWLLEARHQREIDRRIGNWVISRPIPRLTIYQLHRLTKVGFLLTILMGACPDALVLFAWGEADDATMIALFAIDRWCDGLLLLPFLWSTMLVLWGGQALDHRLASEPSYVKLRPSWLLAQQKIKMVAVVLLIALGVTYSKAMG
jgi:hypothetical protein